MEAYVSMRICLLMKQRPVTGAMNEPVRDVLVLETYHTADQTECARNKV